MDKLKEQVESQINSTIEEGVTPENVDYIYRLIDIHKDIANEEYWKKKEEKYMRGYGEGYNEGYGRYRGEDAMMEMQESYDEYNEAYEESMNGNYGAEGGMVKSAEGIMRNIFEITKELSEADVPEVKHVIQKYARKISEMR